MNKVNEVALEVSAANEVNADEVKFDVNAKEEAPEVSITESNELELHVAHNEVKEEMSKGKLLEVKPDEVKSEVNVKAKVEVFGMKEVKSLKDGNKVEVFDAKVNNGKVVLRLCDKKAEAKQSRPANWDPGELPDAKDQMEMLDVEEVVNLVNIDKVGLQLSVKEVRSSSGAIEKALLIVLFLLRFVNGFRRKCPIELSDYG